MRSKKAKKQPAEGKSTLILSDDKQAELALTSLRDLARIVPTNFPKAKGKKRNSSSKSL